MVSLGAPEFLYLLLLLPVAVFLFWIIRHQIEKVRSQFEMKRLARVSRVSSRFRHIRSAAWFLLTCTSLIVAAADPRIEQIRETAVYKKTNPIFILDTSLSMRAKDIAPSRLGRAAEEIRNFILHRNENIGQMGLVTFSGSSMILSYLTSDAQNILFYLDYLLTGPQRTFGTDIGAAIKSALVLLEKEQELDASLQSEDMIFILISDGEDHGDALREAVRQTAQLGIRIHCLGLGSQMGGYIPMGERDGRTVYLLNEGGQRVLSTFDETALRWVAGATGGQYYRSYSGAELYRNLNKILWSERKILRTKTETEQTSLHYWFIAAAFSALSLFLID